jgi:hypothetical protein
MQLAAVFCGESLRKGIAIFLKYKNGDICYAAYLPMEILK